MVVAWILVGAVALPGVIIASVAARLVGARAQRSKTQRIAVIGSSSSAEALRVQLERAGDGRRKYVGRIGHRERGSDASWLGSLDHLRETVEEHDVDLLLLASGVSRIDAFETLTGGPRLTKAALQELNVFYEHTFRHVAIAEINAAWFQWALQPRAAIGISPAKRSLDLVVCAVIGLMLLPLLPLVAWLICRDGGPLFYRQVRIGEGGEPFTILKFRTMVVASDGASPWTQQDDDRITPVGRWLRRTHLDEWPQLLNVLRGEMSIVGPRPEQPGYVSDLERELPFYSRRHIVRPGLTGWAQVNCGYAGSARGTAWKLSHDLYYMHHKGFGLDLEILLRTVGELWARPSFSEPEHMPLVFGHTSLEPAEELVGTA